MDDCYNIGFVNANLARDIAAVVTPRLKITNFAQQFHWADLASSDILDQAHQKTILLGCFSNDGRDFRLSQSKKCFESALTAYEVVFFTVGRFWPTRNRDRLFQTQIGNIRNDTV